MVFCYKLITESPRKSGSVSPRKRSPTRTSHDSASTHYELMALDFKAKGDAFLNSIPERDWRLLTALARKREEEEEREKLADQFHKMWLKEKQERELVEEETSTQYKRYLHEKRAQERSWQDFKRLQRTVEQQIKKGHIIDFIRHKDQRSADLLALQDDRKMNELLNNAMEEEFRAFLAADKRIKQSVIDESRRQLELVHTHKRVKDASKRRTDMLRNASQRVAITNALSTWEAAIIKQELAVEQASRRAHNMAKVALTHARSVRIARDRDARLRRARRLAAFTARLRDAVKTGKL